MKKLHVLTTALAAAAVLAACGGESAGDQAPRVAFKTMVNYGDSLSDVGSYDVSVVALQGGGHFSINGKGATGLSYINWTEFLAGTLQLSQPCAAETGLHPNTTIIPGAPDAPETFHDTGATPCYNYAQGGARVTSPVGPGNVALLNLADSSTYSNAVGALTVPVKDQVANFTAHGGKYDDSTLVTVMAGGNDLFIAVATIQATAVATGNNAAAVNAAIANAGAAMQQAAKDEAGYVAGIIAAGATHVVVVNLPDVSFTPYALAAEKASPGSQKMVLGLVQAFNQTLSAALAAAVTDDSKLLVVDAFTNNDDQIAHPSQYALTNVTTPACTSSSSLECTATTLISAPDNLAATPSLANGYLYADAVHPTPYGYQLLAKLVGEQMAIKGWL